MGKSLIGQFGFRLFGPSKQKVQYSSTPTRFSSLHGFMGGAELDDERTGLDRNPTDPGEDLRAKFKSQVCEIDMPRMWGYPNVVRKLAGYTLPLSEEIDSYRRVGGEPLDWDTNTQDDGDA